MKYLFGLVALSLCLLGQADSHSEVPKKIFQKIATHHLWDSCWGHKNNLQYYLATKKAMDTCKDLAPNFDIDFGFGEEMEQPVGNTFNTLPGFLPSSQSSPPSRFAPSAPSAPSNVDPNSYEAYMAFVAFQQALKRQRSYSKNRLFRRSIETPTQEDIQEYMADVREYASEMKDNIGNLTCVMATLNLLDDNLRVNIDFFLNGLWNDLVEKPDPEFKARMKEAYSDCHILAQSVPQSLFDKMPVAKDFGRNMLFFKCAKKLEKSLCAKQELARWLEEWYGPWDAPKAARYNMPVDKYESAMVAFKVLSHSKSPAEKFVSKALFGGDFD